MPTIRRFAWAAACARVLLFPMSRPAAHRLPADIHYGVDDVPPPLTVAVQALQHTGLVAINFVIALLIVQRAGADEAARAGAMSMVMVMCGVGTLLNAYRLGPFGSGHLLPVVASSIYLGPALLAVQAGGLPLLAGMLVFAGVVEMAVARALPRLRPFFPPEIAGLVIFLVGMTLAVIGVRDLFGIANPAAMSPEQRWIGALTLALMIGLQVWGRGVLGLAAALLGMVGGYVAGWYFDALPAALYTDLAHAPALAWPRWGPTGWAFDAALVLPFALAALASALKAMGNVALAQRVNDAAWVRPDMDSVGRGLLADGLTTAFGGVIGAVCGANPGSSNGGLVVATGVASRRVAAATGVLLIVMAFVPVTTVLFLDMPPVVSGAVLLFTACFIMSNGVEMIASRLLDARKTLVIGLSIAAGIAVEVFPDAVRHAPPWLLSVVGSSLVCGTVLALALNGVFRIGLRQYATLNVEPGGYRVESLQTFVEHHGAEWGARRDVITRVGFVLDQLVDTVIQHCRPQGAVELRVSFDEFSLHADLDYAGLELALPAQRPTPDEIIDSEDGVRRLAGYLLRRSADAISVSSRDGHQQVQVFFEH